MTNRRTLLEATAIGLTVFFLLLFLGRGFGPYWDTWFYYDIAVRWSKWLSSWWSAEKGLSLLSDARTFFPPTEQRHPPLLEMGGGFLHALFGSLVGRVSAVRLMVEIFAALWSAVSYAFLKRRLGSGLALVGVALFWGSPRFMLYSVLFAIDGLIASVYGLALLSFLLWNTEPKARPEAEEAAGPGRWLSPDWRGKSLIYLMLVLALYTKLQALFLLPILILWAGLSAYRRGAGWNSLLTQMARALGICLMAGLTVFALWPALWLDFPTGLKVYSRFITQHSNVPVLYFGKLYVGAATPPWHYPWVLSFLAIPLFFTLPALTRGIRGALAAIGNKSCGTRPEEALLWMGALVPLLASSLPHAPKYDGIRLLLPAYGPLGLLAALEIAAWWRTLETRLLGNFSGLLKKTLLLAAGVIVLLPSLRIYPHNLVYYSPLIGGTRGARAHGFDLDYLGVQMHRLNPKLRELARPGDIVFLAGCNAVVRFEDKEGWTSFPRGVLPVDFKILRDATYEGRQVFAILSSRYSDLGPEALQVLEQIPPIATVEYQGERLFSLHRITRSFVEKLPDREGVLRVPKF